MRGEFLLSVIYFLFIIGPSRAETRTNIEQQFNIGGDGLNVSTTILLHPYQRKRLSLIQSGSLTKKDIEIVVARYMEDVSWTHMYSSLLTIYDKSGYRNFSVMPTFNTMNNNSRSSGVKVISLPNVGRESHTYLYHIVHNYHNLSNVTVFTQGTMPTPGTSHLIKGSNFHDFVLNPRGHFMFTGAVYFPTVAHIHRRGYSSRNKFLADRIKSKDEGCFNLHTESSSHRGLPTGLITHIANRCIEEGINVSSYCSLPLFWKQYIKLDNPPGDTVFFSQGAIFSATAKQIRRRPLSDYQALLRQTSLNVDPSAGYFLEWVWYYLLTSELSACSHEDVMSSVGGTSPKQILSAWRWTQKCPAYDYLDFPTRAQFHKHSSNLAPVTVAKLNKDNIGTVEAITASLKYVHAMLNGLNKQPPHCN